MDRRLIALSDNGTARQRVVGPLRHDSWVTTAKHSPPQGYRIITVTFSSEVRVYDNKDGRLLVHGKIRASSAVAQHWSCLVK